MKKTDVAMIILVASVSVIISYFIAKATPIGSSADKTVKVKTIDAIKVGDVQPDPRVFNKDNINPSVEIQIPSSSQDNSNAPSGQ
jgi:hypothetical protein